MAGRSGPKHPHRQPPMDKVRQLQRRLWVAAKRSPERRFHALLDRIYRRDVLWEAWRRVKANRGAAGVDRETLAVVEQYGSSACSTRSLRAARRHLSPAAGPAAIYPQGRWPPAAARHPDGPGSGRANGDPDRAGADLRGRLPGLVVRLPAEAQRDTGPGNIAGARRLRRQPGAGRGYPRLLWQHRSHEAAQARGAAGLGSPGAEAAPAVARGRCDGRRGMDGDEDGHAARRRHLAVALEHLPACPRSHLGGPVCAPRHAGPLRRRLRGHVRHDGGGRGGSATRGYRCSRASASSCIRRRRGPSISRAVARASTSSGVTCTSA